MSNVHQDRPDDVPQPQGPGDPRTQIAADWSEWFNARRAAVDRRISDHLKLLKAQKATHSRLLEAIEYSLAQPGKRLRPILVLEACRVCGGAEDDAWPAALAIECVHTFSLIHDDLPAMDDDNLRRGMPTSHKVFGEGPAILAGDWLLTHAFSLLGDAPERISVRRLVGAISSGTEDMIIGQGADLAGETEPTRAELVRFIHRHKTARLLESCCSLGAISARAENQDEAALAEYGRHLGLVFQIVDDLLDRTSSTATMGKQVGKDARESKQTYPAAFGLEESRRTARNEIESAVSALAPFGETAARLRDLAWFVLNRDR